MKAVERADELDPVNGEVLKQCTILAGVIAEAGHVNEKTFLANNFKAYLDAAVAVSPADPVLLHMRGRFIYQLTMLTADERDATRFLDEMSEPSLQLALVDLTKAYEQEPTAIDNLLYMARCLEGSANGTRPGTVFNRLTGWRRTTGPTSGMLREAADMLAKMGPPPAAPPPARPAAAAADEEPIVDRLTPTVIHEVLHAPIGTRCSRGSNTAKNSPRSLFWTILEAKSSTLTSTPNGDVQKFYLNPAQVGSIANPTATGPQITLGESGDLFGQQSAIAVSPLSAGAQQFGGFQGGFSPFGASPYGAGGAGQPTGASNIPPPILEIKVPPPPKVDIPGCYVNGKGFVCCNKHLETVIDNTMEAIHQKQLEQEAKTGQPACNLQASANLLQKAAEGVFGVSFESLLAPTDFASRTRFMDDLMCKTEQNGKYVIMYATPVPYPVTRRR
ncbi:unnamed protein product, partial [Mesorhabditis spiculigera]